MGRRAPVSYSADICHGRGYGMARLLSPFRVGKRHAARPVRLCAQDSVNCVKQAPVLTLATTAPGEAGIEDLRRAEIFASVQGEGPSAGRMCAFVRLSRCNLACTWCDTAYTWRFDDSRPHRDDAVFDRKAEQVTLPEADVAAAIAALGCDRLVVTGGEPLLQGAALARMAAALPANVGIEVETNGTVRPHPAFAPFVAQYTVSPKLAHSGNDAALARDPAALAAWAADPRAVFKFVVATPGDVAEALALADAAAMPRARVWLMPEGTAPATLREREAWLKPLSETAGVHYSDRLHIHLYGDTRGT